jgi:hypothetical protein
VQVFNGDGLISKPEMLLGEAQAPAQRVSEAINKPAISRREGQHT